MFLGKGGQRISDSKEASHHPPHSTHVHDLPSNMTDTQWSKKQHYFSLQLMQLGKKEQAFGFCIPSPDI